MQGLRDGLEFHHKNQEVFHFYVHQRHPCIKVTESVSFKKHLKAKYALEINENKTKMEHLNQSKENKIVQKRKESYCQMYSCSGMADIFETTDSVAKGGAEMSLIERLPTEETTETASVECEIRSFILPMEA